MSHSFNKLLNMSYRGITTSRSFLKSSFSLHKLSKREHQLSPSSFRLTKNTLKYYCTSEFDEKLIDPTKYVNGLLKITIPLNSGAVKCMFTLNPILDNLGDFIEMIKTEDKGIEKIVIKNTDGVIIASRTSIQTLLEQDFILHINDIDYLVKSPVLQNFSKEDIEKICEVKNLISHLHSTLNLQQYNVLKEKHLTSMVKNAQKELEPLEEQRDKILIEAEKRADLTAWIGLGLLYMYFGAMLRLIFWDFNWDVMEPITYLATVAMTMIGLSYFIITKQEFLYSDGLNRQRIKRFHKISKELQFDVEKYNTLNKNIQEMEANLIQVRKLTTPVSSRILKE